MLSSKKRPFTKERKIKMKVTTNTTISDCLNKIKYVNSCEFKIVYESMSKFVKIIVFLYFMKTSHVIMNNFLCMILRVILDNTY